MSAKLISPERFQAIVDLLDGNHTDGVSMSSFAVAKELGECIETVVRIATGAHVYQIGRQSRKFGNPMALNSPRRTLKGSAVYLPTPEQIEIECERLRAARIIDEDDPGGWMPPVYSARGLVAC